jgi:hypothetical protein
MTLVLVRFSIVVHAEELTTCEKGEKRMKRKMRMRNTPREHSIGVLEKKRTKKQRTNQKFERNNRE